MFKLIFMGNMLLFTLSCNTNDHPKIPGKGITDSAVVNGEGKKISSAPQSQYIDQLEALKRLVNFDTLFADKYFKSLDFKRSYWISSECFIEMVNKMGTDGLGGIKIYFGAENTPPYPTSLQWIATNKDEQSDFGYKFNLGQSSNPSTYGIDIDPKAAQTKREKFAELYRQQAPTNLSPGEKGDVDNVSTSCWFDYDALKQVSDQLKYDPTVSGLHLYIGAYYDGKDDGRQYREYDVQTTLHFVATKTDQQNKILTDDWDFLQETHSLVLNHGHLCPNKCN